MSSVSHDANAYSCNPRKRCHRPAGFATYQALPDPRVSETIAVRPRDFGYFPLSATGGKPTTTDSTTRWLAPNGEPRPIRTSWVGQRGCVQPLATLWKPRQRQGLASLQGGE